MKILISAAETSSDAHGAELLKALRKEIPAGVRLDAFGIGGPKLKAAGLRTVVDARELLAIGFLEIVGHLPRILRALGRISAAVRQERPDVAVVIDYPDFHFRLARRLKQENVPAVYYIPPKVWVWRKRRVRILRELFAKILCILPFEQKFYEGEGMAVSYVGNPLTDELPLKMTREEARGILGIPASARVLLVMPGSRASELKHHLELFLGASLQTAKKMNTRLVALLPFPETLDRHRLSQRVQEWAKRNEAAQFLELRISSGNSAECMVAADAGLVKSGTSTLEAGLLACPHCVAYKTNWITAWIFKYLIRYRGPVGLVNLVAGWEEGRPYLVREIILGEATVPTLSAEMMELLTDEAKKTRLSIGFGELRTRVLGGVSDVGPSQRAAREILELLKLRKGAEK